MALKCLQSGVCCKVFYINLTRGEYESGAYETQFDEYGKLEWKTARKAGAHILKKKKDGSCIYLKNNLCSIHKRRPKVCRGFFCMSKAKQYAGMVDLVKKKSKELKKGDRKPAVVLLENRT